MTDPHWRNSLSDERLQRLELAESQGYSFTPTKSGDFSMEEKDFPGATSGRALRVTCKGEWVGTTEGLYDGWDELADLALEIVEKHNPGGG